MPFTRNKIHLYGVILAGGEGRRLWPVSRKETPKYSISIGRIKKSLLKQAYERLKKIISKDKIFVITQKSQSRLVEKQLPELNKNNIIKEPFGRNTAAAIGSAAVIIGKLSPDAVMIVAPADHFIPEKHIFTALIKKAVKAARCANSLVTIGIKPAYPETGYGYIKIQKSPPRFGIYKTERFVEKPDLTQAKKFVKNGYLWNSGIFVWEITAILEAIRDCAPKLFLKLKEFDAGLGENFQAAPYRWKISALLAKIYKNIGSISIDKAVLEKSRNVYVISSSLRWDDVGSWLSARRMLKTDSNGNAVNASFKGIDNKNCIIISNDKKHLVAAYGLNSMIIVHTPDATLVCACDKSGEVKDLVNIIAGNKNSKKFCGRSFIEV